VRESRTSVDAGGGRAVSALLTLPEGPEPAWTFVYAPGAGSNLHDAFGAYLAGRLPGAGTAVVRFQFPYMEAAKSGPDRSPVLESTWRAVVERFRPQSGRLAVGGRSMGGRIASQVVAAGPAADFLVLFAYPLHPPGRPERSRDEHLPRIAVPTLFCSGTRDDFAAPEELRVAAAKVRGSRVHLLEGADHGFNVRKSSGRTRADVWEEACAALLESFAG